MHDLLSEKKIGLWKGLSAFVLVLLGTLTIYYAPVLFGGECFYKADNCFYFEPFFKLIGDALRGYRLALWNPYLDCGMPQLAVPSPGIFYPPNIIFAFLPYGSAFACLLAFHQIVAGVGAYLFVNSLGWSRGAAFTAGMTCAFTGYMFSLTSNHTLPASAAWLPAVLWSMRGISTAYVARQICPMVIMGSITTFLMITAGRPEISVAGMSIVALFVLVQTILIMRHKKEEEEISSNFIWQVAALFFGMMLATPMLLPVLEWMATSPRAHGMDVKYVFLWSANYYDLLSMVFAQPFGDLTVIATPYLPLSESRTGHIPFLPSPLVGPVVATLAVWGFGDKKWRGRYWALAVLLATMTFVIGENTVVLPKIFSHLSYATLFRYPIKLIIIPIFCLALAAGRGIYAITRGSVKEKTWYVTLALWTFACLFGVALYAAGSFDKPLHLPRIGSSAPAQLLLGKAILLGSVIGFSTLGIGALTQRHRITPQLGSIVLNVFVLASLCIPAFCFRTPTIGKDFFDHKPLVLTKLEKLKYSAKSGARVFPLYIEPVHRLKGYNWRADAPVNVNYYQFCRDLLLPNTNIDWQVPSAFGYEAAETQSYKDFVFEQMNDCMTTMANDPDNDADDPDRNRVLYDFCRGASVAYVTDQPVADEGPITQLNSKFFKLVDTDKPANVRLYSVVNPLTRSYISNDWHWVDSESESLRMMRDPDKSHYDPINHALIERLKDSQSYTVPLPDGYSRTAVPNLNVVTESSINNKAIYTRDGIMIPAVPSGKNIPSEQKEKQQPPRFLKDEPEHISLSVSLEKSSFLILSDHYYPGWKAQIDGLDAPIFRANGLFRAVYILKGAHLVQFDFEPESLHLGYECALLAVVFLILVLLRWLGPYIWLGLKRSAGQDV
jgi:hypothetical protein